jgi:two-component system, response regulator YesN
MPDMAYKVFFVEDEIVTREGIRDNVDWQGNGFEFCGEAADGEVALSLLRTARPDILITDIKMPFMDGLQLCKIVRERMPWVKIIILSGHDEFEYAQQAINLGVTEYLLKPVTVKNIHQVLRKVAAQLDQEKKEHEHLQHLREQIEENRAGLRERLLLKVVVGAVSSTEAIEKGQLLELDLIARCYLVVILRIELRDRSEQFDYEEYLQIQQVVSGIVDNMPDVFLLRKDWDELILLMKGNAPEFVEEERERLLERIKQEINKTRYQLTVGIGTPKKRLAELHQSFIEALVSFQSAANKGNHSLNTTVDKTDLLKVDRSAVEYFLRCGTKEDFDEFFNVYIRPVGESVLTSYLIKNYIFVDIVLATVKLVNELGGDIDQVIPELNTIETSLASITTVDQLREQVYKILVNTLVFRDRQASSLYTGTIQKAKEFIEHHSMESDLSLNQVAAQVNLSPSHFSVVFSKEACQTFKEYLTEVRITKAKELLRTTTLRSAEIAYQVGYSDPHYFSHVFRKKTGLSPNEFRAQVGES